jgi:hypothetical protein
MRPAVRALCLAVLAVSVTLGAGGCAVARAPGLPDGIGVTVFQDRFDYAGRQLELKVVNGTTESITVSQATFTSTRFVSPAAWDGEERVPAGGARDFRVQLPAPACETTDANTDTVTLEVTLAGGVVARGTLTPVDPQSTLPAVHAQDCLIASVESRAAIAMAPTLTWTPGAHAPAMLELTVVPTSADGSVTIDSLSGTVLLSLVDRTGAVIAALPVASTFTSASAKGAIPVSIIPSRCDPHAVEEDKRGTFFPLEVHTSDGLRGRIYIPVSDAVRRDIYEFYADYCGLP